MSHSRVNRKIASRSNPFVRDLIGKRDQKMIFEGEKLVKDILKRAVKVSILILHESLEAVFPVPGHVREVWYVSDSVMNKISSLKKRSMYIGVVDPLNSPINLDEAESIIVLDNIQDPVNMGSVFRCAAAFGISHVFLTGDSVKTTNSKFLRVAQDACFTVNHQYMNSLEELLDMLRNKGFSIYTTSSGKILNHVPIKDIRFPCAIIFGNEGQGIDPKLIHEYPSIKIDQTSNVESLNVGMCACIVMYELQKLK